MVSMPVSLSFLHTLAGPWVEGVPGSQCMWYFQHNKITLMGLSMAFQDGYWGPPGA